MIAIDTFDSRALRHTDCYGQRFMRPGTYRYDVVPAAWVDVATERPYLVEVVAEGAPADDAGHPHEGMAQHTVVVRADGNRFVPDREKVTVDAGDLVLWHGPDATRTPFAVVGDKDFFGSPTLVNECGFSHAFASAGEYRWVDANGSGIGGVVRVTDPKTGSRRDFERWQKQLATGTLVMVADGKAEPAEVEVATGQTVFFTVVTGPGITVTDARLVEGHPRGPRPELVLPPAPRPRASAATAAAERPTAKATKATKATTATPSAKATKAPKAAKPKAGKATRAKAR